MRPPGRRRISSSGRGSCWANSAVGFRDIWRCKASGVSTAKGCGSCTAGIAGCRATSWRRSTDTSTSVPPCASAMVRRTYWRRTPSRSCARSASANRSCWRRAERSSRTTRGPSGSTAPIGRGCCCTMVCSPRSLRARPGPAKRGTGMSTSTATGSGGILPDSPAPYADWIRPSRASNRCRRSTRRRCGSTCCAAAERRSPGAGTRGPTGAPGWSAERRRPASAAYVCRWPPSYPPGPGAVGRAFDPWSDTESVLRVDGGTVELPEFRRSLVLRWSVAADGLG